MPIFRPEILKLVFLGQNLTNFLSSFFLNTPYKTNKNKMLLLLSKIAYLGFCGQFCQKKWPFLTTDVFGHVEKNPLVKHQIFIPDSVRAWKIGQKTLIYAEQTSFKCFYNFAQKVTNFWNCQNIIILTWNGLILSFLIGFVYYFFLNILQI